MALHVKSGEPTSDYESLLNYYAERGSLLEIDHKPNLTVEEVSAIQDKVKLALKLSE